MSQKKQIFKLNILKKLLNDENSCVSLVQSTRLLALPPFFLTDMKSGILYLLNSMLKKYDRSLGGIVIGYQNIKVLMDENTGIIPIGTSEMEVNISVEFYIFQPKIGSYLEGIINKKSNNHIGCLVHQYFNATILKPEDVFYEDWICKDFNVDDKIIFKVIDLDFTTLLPYIEGIYDGRTSLDKIESKSSGNCDRDNITSNINRYEESMFSREFLRYGTNSDRISDDDFLDSKKSKSKCKDVNAINAKSNLDGNLSFTDSGTKKKKKKKEKLIPSVDNTVKENMDKCSGDKELINDMISEKLQEDEKKKKKKKKRKENEKKEQEGPVDIKNVEKKDNLTLLPSHVQEKLLQVEDENSNDFVKFSKSKKEKKKKNQNEEPIPCLNKTVEGAHLEEVEDNVLYSTQLEPVQGSKKMRISFCSPIPQTASFEGKLCDKSVVSSVRLKSEPVVEAMEKEAKRKHKKRKREKQQDSEDSPNSKKMKILNTSSLKNEETKKEVNGSKRKSLVQIMMEQMCQEELNRVKEKLNMSSSDKEEIKKEEKKKKKRENELVDLNSTKSQLNGEDRKFELQSTFSELFRQQLQKVKDEFTTSDKGSVKESKKKEAKAKKDRMETSKEKIVVESSKVKENKNAQINCINGNEKKSDMKNMMDELYKKQIDRVKEEMSRSYTEIVKEKKKKKKTHSKETSGEKSHDSLYDKLLNEAKSAMVVEKLATPILPLAAELGRKKKDSELSDVSTTSSKKKKSKHNNQKIEDCQKPPTKFRNGSMYDVESTPEKINPERSLFSDSEQSHSSPVKKMKKVNGFEAESGKSKVQNMFDELSREQVKRLKSESDKESLKGSEKIEKKNTSSKSQVPSGKEESLYEKLLKEARSLVHIKDVSLPVKKEKKEKKK